MHSLAAQNGRAIGVVYYCGQTSLNHNTDTIPEELHWRTLNLDTVLHPRLSTCTVYTQILSITKSLPS